MDRRYFAPRLYRGMMPEKKEDLREFVRVISLQDQTVEAPYVWRERDWCNELGIEFIHAPMSMIAPPSVEDLESAYSKLLNPPEGRTLIHCFHGVDRTGMAVAYYRTRHDGWTFGRAIGEAIECGFHLDRYCWWLPVVKDRFR